METDANSAAAAEPSMGRVLFRWVRRGLYVLIVLVTIVALYHAEENFRGKRAWDRYEKAAVARGVNFDFAATIPPSVPDEQNAAHNPVVAAWFPKPQQNDPNWPSLLPNAEQRIAARRNGPDRRTTERFMDLVALKEALAEEQASEKNRRRHITEQDRTPEERAAAAPGVLEALQVYQPALGELRAASKRPFVRYPVVYKLDDPFSILLPHLAKLKSIVQELRVEASAKLAAGRADDALHDVMFMFWLTDSIHNEPFLINQLVRVACLQITMQPVWEGLAMHQWNDAQLQQISRRLQQFDFVSDFQGPMAAERAASVGMIHRLRRNISSQPGVTDLFDAASLPAPRPAVNVFARLVPRGWFYFEALNYCVWLDEQLQDGFDLQKRTIDAQQMEENNARMEHAFKENGGLKAVFQHQVFARLLLPAISGAARKFALAQVTADEAALACALERYRLANGKLPDRLDALVPKFLPGIPHDVLTGEPLKYERVSDTDFVLSSVGWMINDASAPAPTPGEGSRPKNRPGDWVWHSAAR